MRSTLSTFNEVWQRNLGSRLKQTQQFSETQFLIGCSGGMDSMLLLYLMSIFSQAHSRDLY
jgi:tRNA(Ile)-lysidine synthase